MEYSKSRKGNRVLLKRGYEYLHYRFQIGVTFWRCRYYPSLKCHSSLRTENDKVIQKPINHSHDSCPQKARAEVLQEQMKDKMTAHQPLIEMLLAKHLLMWVLTFYNLLTKKDKHFVRWTSLIVYAFILIYCCTAIKVSIVLFIVCKILPKYILHSCNLYDLDNSPVAYNIV